MNKKINILIMLLILFISISAVSASDDNQVEINSDDSIQDTLELSLDEDINSQNSDNEVISSSSHTITNDNYVNYFNPINGKLISSDVKSGDTINLDGSFSDKNFTFDIPVKIVGTSTNDMKNSIITISNSASGSSISNLNIKNTKDRTYGIFLNTASRCTIQGCNINNTGMSSYCICLANGANYNNIVDNKLTAYGITYGHGSFTRSTPPLLLSGSHYNNVLNNHVEADDANGIYLSSYSGGPLNGGNSNFNIIRNNLVHYNVLPTSWAYGIQIMGNNNTIESNTVIGGYRGVSTAGSGNKILKNQIINLTGADYNHPGVMSGGEFGIVASYNSQVYDNKIIGAKVISTGAGISAIDNSIVENNLVDVALKGRGIVAGGSNVIVRSNIVSTDSGSGIYEKDEGSGLLVDKNNVTSNSGVGILIEKLSSKRMPKNVTIINNVISTNNKYAIDASGVQEDTSYIDLESNKIIGSGLINLPAGVIDTSKPTYIFKGKTHDITSKNIRTYINDNGGLTSEINDGDTLNFIGSFSNEVIYITKGVKITGNHPVFYNSTFKVTTGNVLIENLIIINDKAERVNAWGIFINQASGVRISNNNIKVNDPKAAYAIYVLESSDIEVVNNILISQGDYLTFTLLSYASESCTFINNTISTIGTGTPYRFSPEKCIDGNEIVINGKSYCLDGNELVIDGTSYCLDGNELVIDGTSYCLDGNELVIDGTSYCLDGNEVVINGKSYCLDGNELVIDGTSYCLDGNELVIDGTSYCLDGNEVVINGSSYNVGGSAYSTGNAHVVSEIYQTYGILLLYSSNNLVSDNHVDVTSKLEDKHNTTGNGSSQNSLVGIDLYFNCHNNVISHNNVFIKSNDNYIYGMGVLGYFTGHSAPDGQGATNNTFNYNTITLEGIYCAEGIIIGDESEDSIMEHNVINVKSDCVAYGIYFEMSQKSIVNNNTLNLDAQVVYGIIGYDSNDNYLSNNDIDVNAKFVYGIIFSNGNDNSVLNNKIHTNATSSDITFLNLDSLGYGNAGIYLRANSTKNLIENNEVVSVKDYAVLLDEGARNNIIRNNYLDCEKGIANRAIYLNSANTILNNYKYVANALYEVNSIFYRGIGDFILTFDCNLDGAVVELYDLDNVRIATSVVSNNKTVLKYQFDKSYVPSNYLFYAKLLKEDYKASLYEIPFEIYNGNLNVSLKDVSIVQGVSGNIVATVLDQFGNPISGATVQFNRINSANRPTSMGTAKTNANGVATLSYKVQSSLSEGLHNISAQVNGVYNYNDAMGSAKLTVLIASITGGNDYSVYYGDTVNYKVRILGTGNQPVGAGESVVFKINGISKTIKTDSNGYATFSVKLSQGTYKITATYKGLVKSNTIVFKPTLIAKNVVGKKSKKTTFSVKLLNKNGKILKNKKITFKIGSNKYSAKTNSKGIAKLSVKFKKVGSYKVYSSYGGCKIQNTIKIK